MFFGDFLFLWYGCYNSIHIYGKLVYFFKLSNLMLEMNKIIKYMADQKNKVNIMAKQRCKNDPGV